MPSGVKYLGIQLNPNWDDIILFNVEPLVQKIILNLDKREKFKLNLWGTINVINMVVAPQFNYASASNFCLCLMHMVWSIGFFKQ